MPTQLDSLAAAGWLNFADAVLLVDDAGQIVLLNRRAQEMFEMDADAWRGAPASDFYRALAARCASDADLARQFENHAQRAAELPRLEFTLQTPTLRVLETQWFCLAPTAPRACAYGVMWRDLTRAQATEQMQKQLLATVSHELRTPLASIKGFATTLLRQDVRWDDATQREFLRIIEEESNRLEELIDNLLDMSQMEAGALRIQREPVQLRGLLREAVENAQRRTEAHWFVVDLPSELPRVWADPRRIRQVLNNLLENAIKYSPDGGEISVRCEVEATRVIVSIADRGVGIPPALRARVFDPFFQVDGSSTRGVGGSGLGLAIVKGIIAAHHGAIWVEPMPERGSVFRFTLPIVTDAALTETDKLA
ncbi:MAG: hypothetical protein B6D41_21850 [Chloroflexi bacterium UTCFX4]|jgi:signal transduction histidine kinase|nr:MAG: hypothetical protein B6D41_21850 [Chloroflexi bacterium UTCFX4]